MTPSASQTRRLNYVLALNVVMIAALLVVGPLDRSLGVLAAGGDYLADSTAIALGLLAVRLRDRHHRPNAPTYVALVNVLMLLVITGFVLIAAVRRLLMGSPDIAGLPVLIVASIATLAMVAGALILGRGAAQEDLHMRSVLLDTVADGLSSATVAVVGAVIAVTGRLYWLDAAAAAVISLIIGFSALTLLRDVAHVIRRGQPVTVGDDND